MPNKFVVRREGYAPTVVEADEMSVAPGGALLFYNGVPVDDERGAISALVRAFGNGQWVEANIQEDQS